MTWTVVYRDGDLVTATAVEHREPAIGVALRLRRGGKQVLAIRSGSEVIDRAEFDRMITGSLSRSA